MNSNRNTLIKNYISDIKTLFPIMSKNEKHFLQGFQQTVEDYASDQEHLSSEELLEEFGTPQDVVNSYFNQVDITYLIAKIRKTKFIKRITLSILVLVVGLTVYRGVLIYHDYKTSMKEHIYKEEIMIEEE